MISFTLLANLIFICIINRTLHTNRRLLFHPGLGDTKKEVCFIAGPMASTPPPATSS